MKTSIMKPPGLAAGLLAGVALAVGTAAQAAPDAAKPMAAKADLPVSRLMADRPAPGAASVIVKITGPLTAPQQATLSLLGADITRHLPFIQSLALRLPARNLAKLAALPFVTRLSYDGTTQKCDEFTVGSSEAGAAYAQYGLNGTGIGVAVLDSGVHVTPDLDAVSGGKGYRVSGSFNAIPYPAVTAASSPLVKLAAAGLPQGSIPYDLCGHGTHVAGIIAGNGAWSAGGIRTFYGVARNANIIDVRVLDQNGQGTVSSVLAGLQWAVANKSRYNIRVLNLSLGHPVGESYTTDPLCQAVETAYKAGIVVVCAAGNDGRLDAAQDQPDNEGWGTNYGSIVSPGNDP